MEKLGSDPFLIFWHRAMIVGAGLMILAGLIIYIFHNLKVAWIRGYKEKYDFINEKEIKTYKLVFLCFGIAALMAINLYGMGEFTKVEVWFFVRLFMGLAGGTLVTYVSFLVLDYYFPTVVHRKLNKWRYKARINPETGNAMRLLSEEEEDVHLEPGMLEEENIFSIDYDVWVDEKSGDVKVEKYPGRLQALRCKDCNFYTMKVVREEITRQPTALEEGELVKHYQCLFCKSIRATAFKISNKEAEDYKLVALKSGFKKNKNIDLVRLEIHSALSGKKYFDFQNLDQARKFIEEYEDA